MEVTKGLIIAAILMLILLCSFYISGGDMDEPITPSKIVAACIGILIPTIFFGGIIFIVQIIISKKKEK